MDRQHRDFRCCAHSLKQAVPPTIDIRKEAQSLLNLLEVHDRPSTEKPKSEGPAIIIPDETPPK